MTSTPHTPRGFINSAAKGQASAAGKFVIASPDPTRYHDANTDIKASGAAAVKSIPMGAGDMRTTICSVATPGGGPTAFNPHAKVTDLCIKDSITLPDGTNTQTVLRMNPTESTQAEQIQARREAFERYPGMDGHDMRTRMSYFYYRLEELIQDRKQQEKDVQPILPPQQTQAVPQPQTTVQAQAVLAMPAAAPTQSVAQPRVPLSEQFMKSAQVTPTVSLAAQFNPVAMVAAHAPQPVSLPAYEEPSVKVVFQLDIGAYHVSYNNFIFVPAADGQTGMIALVYDTRYTGARFIPTPPLNQEVDTRELYVAKIGDKTIYMVTPIGVVFEDRERLYCMLLVRGIKLADSPVA